MENILTVKSVHDYNAFVGHPDQHPLVSVVEYAKVSPILHTKVNFSIYALFLLDDTLEDLTYGQGIYDYKEGTLVCVSPGQIGGVDYNGRRFERRGWALLFHPDLLRGTSLEETIGECTFFEYHINEALHMTHSEREIYLSLLTQLQGILAEDDKLYQDQILASYIKLILQYCRRFYNRQFAAMKRSGNNLLERFDALIASYLTSDKPVQQGLPTVTWCAQELCLSPNYFSDIVKKWTGQAAMEHIHQAVVRMIKNKLMAGIPTKQIAYDLGLDRSQDLSRLFKRYTGETLAAYLEGIRKGTK
ncbi:MAG: helix-turn-helix domain-containing protein [Bacteroides sp.]|nr:helix-turn-helix domain-containing protein [Bacteroides sp.]